MNTIHKAFAGAALVGTALVGGAIGASMVGTASAQEGDTSTTAVIEDQTADAPERDGASAGPHSADGITEEELTGDTADKVTAAAEAAVEGGTVERVETDAEGAAYEAHVTTAEGERVTVKLDESFAVTSVEEGDC
jgi:hypothetical protein